MKDIDWALLSVFVVGGCFQVAFITMGDYDAFDVGCFIVTCLCIVSLLGKAVELPRGE